MREVLTVDDCFELGKVAYSEADYRHTELWMAEALRQLDQGDLSGGVDAVAILDYLSYSVYQQGELQRALDFTRKLLELGRYHRGSVQAGPNQSDLEKNRTEKNMLIKDSI